ncbi:hypothetical protein EV195_11231 [Tenacibaculum skagerrakense]|uniref:Uncharacterized protein n=1 Tax=Tenacibaculum skagerrakense TaxID=186571 RepID=A0A4R2NLQ6_9FLAO|nr:hypothetical protein [Tenacibaculum skagerrakense]TCP22382.1 hypothetical protein EV195_11231 [Tenacibaculum skagerrakense]
MKKLESLIKFFPLLLLLTTIMGYLSLHTYYDYFNIRILDYLMLSEIPLLFFDKIVIVGGLILFLMIVMFFFESSLKLPVFEVNFRVGEKERVKVLRDRIQKDEKSISQNNKLYIGTMLFLVVFDVMTAFFTDRKFYFPPVLFLFFGIIVYYMIIKIITVNLIKKESAISVISKLQPVITILIVFTVDTYSASYRKVQKIKNDNAIIKEVSFKYNKENIKTDSLLVYLGETNQALFLYRKDSIKTKIYKKSNIDYLQIN